MPFVTATPAEQQALEVHLEVAAALQHQRGTDQPCDVERLAVAGTLAQLRAHARAGAATQRAHRPASDPANLGRRGFGPFFMTRRTA